MIIYNSLAVSVFNSKFLLRRRVSYYMLFRTMFTTRHATRVVNMNTIRPGISVNGNSTKVNLHEATNLKTPQRYNPGQGYTCVNIDSNVCTATGKEIPLHERSHVNIIDNETDLPVGVLSSCKKQNQGFINIAPNNYKGDILPNGQFKEQWMRTYDSPRYYEDINKLQRNQIATEFVNQYSEKIDNQLYKTNVHNKIPSKRVNKDSSELYHENGQPIFDNNGNEIDY